MPLLQTQGRLFVSVTVLLPWPHNVLVSTFHGKQVRHY